MWRFLRHVDRTRIEPLVLFLAAGSYARDVADVGFEAVVMPTTRIRSSSYLATVPKIARLIRRRNVDVVFGWGSTAQVHLSPAALLAGRSRVLWTQTEIPNARPRYRLAHLLPASAIVCPSNFVASAESRFWPRRRHLVIHRGTDEPREPRDADVESLRGTLGIAPGRVVIGNVGRLVSYKRQDMVIRAVAHLRRQGVDVHALIVGGDPQAFEPDYGRRLHELPAELGVSDVVTFTGQVRDATRYLALMNVFVNPAEGEAFGNVTIEAMAAGVPVVATRSGSTGEIVEHGRSGLLVDASPQALAAGIADVVMKPALAATLSSGARARYQSHFTAKQMADALSDLVIRTASNR